MSDANVFPLIWSKDVVAIADWAVTTLGLTQNWRADDANGVAEHVELAWPGGYVSLNVQAPSYANMGPCGIGLRLDSNTQVDEIHKIAQAANANITQPLQESPVAYSFTATDPDGNQWWVHAETGMLNSLRSG